MRRRLLLDYLAHLRLRGAKRDSIKNVVAGLERFFAHLRCERIRDVRQVSEAHVVSFLRRLATERSTRTGETLAVSTQAVCLAAVHGFFRFLEEKRLILVNPARAVPLPKRRRLPRALSEAQVRRMMSAHEQGSPQGQRDRAVLELLYGTGLRLSECVQLDLQDLDLVQGTLLVRNGKGRKDRYVPISGQAVKALALYLHESRPLFEKPTQASHGALFLARGGRRLGRFSVTCAVHAAAAAAGITASPHVLRHSYATHLLQGGADVRQVQELLGHQHLVTTALYTKVDTHELAAMLRRCHPRRRHRRREQPAV